MERALTLPDWMDDALCAEPEYQRLAWFPERGQQTAPAKAVCARCLVRAECLALALEEGLPGIWGGTSEPERRALAG